MAVGRKILDDDDYLIIWTRFFGVDIPLLGHVYVQLKRTGAVLRASSREKRYLLALLGELSRIGPDALADNREFVFENFAGAVFSRGYATWIVFFTFQSPRDYALELADTSHPRQGSA